MAISIDDLEDFENDDNVINDDSQSGSNDDNFNNDDDNFENQIIDNEQNSDELFEEEEGDALTAFLRTKGINDPSKIKFENDETGDIEEVDWNELSEREKYNLLKTSNADPNRQLDNEEINFVNNLRKYNMSVADYNNMVAQQAINAYNNQLQANQNNIRYEIDSIPDDELYLLDLQQKIGDDISDEDLLKALETEKSNPEIYKRKIDNIRNEYHELENQQAQAVQQEQNKINQQRFAQFQNNILNEIQNFRNVGNLDIEMDADDMNDVATMILDKDPAGINYLSKALNNPQNLVKIAWFLTKGEQAFSDISDYMAQQIREVSRNQYKRGLEDGRSGKPSSSSRTRVVRTSQTNKSPIMSIDDLD